MSRAFRSLIWREWRDTRPVMFGCALVTAVLSVLVQHFVFRWKEAEWTGSSLVALTPLLPAVILASDLFASDISSRRVQGLALLPTRLSRVVAAKLAYLGLGIAAFHLFVLVWNALLLALFAKEEWTGPFAAGLSRGRLAVGVEALLVASVLFFSAMSFRSFVSVLLGALSAAALVGTAGMVELDDVTGLKGEGWMWAGVACVVIVSIGAGVFAVLRGPAHTASRGRLAIVGCAALGAVFVPATGGLAVAVERRYHVEPGDDDARFESLTLAGTPPVAVVHVTQRSPDGTNVKWASAVYAVDLSGSDAVRLASHRTSLVGYTDDGALVTWTQGFKWQNKDRVTAVDPRTGEVLREYDPGKYPGVHFDMPDRPAWAKQGFDHTSRQAPDGKSWLQVVAPKAGGPGRAVVSRGMIVFLPQRGRVVTVSEDGALLLNDLLGTEDTTLIAAYALPLQGQWSLSQDGTLLAARTPKGVAIVDVTTGATRWSGTAHWGQWARSVAGRNVLLVPEPDWDHAKIVDFDHEEPRVISGSFACDPTSLRPLADGGFVAISTDHRRVVLLDAECEIVRQLLPEPAR